MRTTFFYLFILRNERYIYYKSILIYVQIIRHKYFIIFVNYIYIYIISNNTYNFRTLFVPVRHRLVRKRKFRRSVHLCLRLLFSLLHQVRVLRTQTPGPKDEFDQSQHGDSNIFPSLSLPN